MVAMATPTMKVLGSISISTSAVFGDDDSGALEGASGHARPRRVRYSAPHPVRISVLSAISHFGRPASSAPARPSPTTDSTGARQLTHSAATASTQPPIATPVATPPPARRPADS